MHVLLHGFALNVRMYILLSYLHSTYVNEKCTLNLRNFNLPYDLICNDGVSIIIVESIYIEPNLSYFLQDVEGACILLTLCP